MRLRDAGWPDSLILGFDLGMLWFADWVESKRNEQIWVPHTDEHKGKSPKPKYEKLSEIFELYDSTQGITKFIHQELIPESNIDAVIEDAFGDEVLF